MLDLNKNKKIIIIAIIVIIVVAIGAYFLTSSLRFDAKLKEASAYSDERWENMKSAYDISFMINDLSQSSVNVEKTEQMKDYFEKAGILLEKEFDTLEAAKAEASTDLEKEYINLLLKRKDTQIKIQEYNEERATLLNQYFKKEISLSEYASKMTAINKKYDETDKPSATIKKSIKKFLDSNPEFKIRMQKLNLTSAFIVNSTKTRYNYIGDEL